MKEHEEFGPGLSKRSARDEDARLEPRTQEKVIDFLRPDFSWRVHLQSQHPRWDFVHFDAIPWAALEKELHECKVALATTAGVYLRGQKPFNVSPGLVSDLLLSQKFFTRGDWSYREIPSDCNLEELRIAHSHYDHTDAQEDINCVFPLQRLQELVDENFIGELAEHHYGLMGYIPEYELVEKGPAAEIAQKLKKEQVDLLLITPGCPLSHQTSAILQRVAESAGIPTLQITLCKDVTEHIGVPRAVFVRFPLGNVLGNPMDDIIQFRVLKESLQAAKKIMRPGQVLDLPYTWVDAE